MNTGRILCPRSSFRSVLPIPALHVRLPHRDPRRPLRGVDDAGARRQMAAQLGQWHGAHARLGQPVGLLRVGPPEAQEAPPQAGVSSQFGAPGSVWATT